MRTMNKILGLAVVAAVAIAVAAPATAGCLPGKTVATFGNGGSTFWLNPGGPSALDTASITGRFWQQGNRALGNEGSCTGFLYFYAPGGGVAMNQFLGDACVTACPAGRLLTLAQAASNDGSKSYFLAASVDEVSGPPTDFAYETLGNLNMIELPKPFVVSSSRATPLVNLTVNIPAVSAGVYGPGAASSVTGYRVLSATGAADPGRSAAAYTSVEATTASTGGAVNGLAIDVDCSNPAVDRWVVTQLQMDQGVLSDLVSGAVRVNCNPGIADPTVPTINKPGKGKGRPTLRP